MRHYWYCLAIIVLSFAIIQCPAFAKPTCELHAQRTVLPANKEVGEYCLVKVKVKFKKPRNPENCTLLDEPQVLLSGMKNLDSQLKLLESEPTAVDDINACVVLKNSVNHREKKLSEVFNQQSYQLNITFLAHNFAKEACRLAEDCKSSLIVSIDQAPTVSIEVESERNDQVAVVNPDDGIDVCCGTCSKRQVSLVTITVTASDPDWSVIKPTDELFKTNNTIQVHVKSASGVGIVAPKLQWMPYKKYQPKKQANAIGITKLELTTEAMCEWFMESVVKDDLSLILSGFHVVTEFAVVAMVETGVERGQLLSNFAKWSAAVRFGNELEIRETETKLGSNATKNAEIENEGQMQQQNEDACADGSCDENFSLFKLLGERGVLSAAGCLIGFAAFGLFCYLCSIVSSMSKKSKSERVIVQLQAVGTATALTGNQTLESKTERNCRLVKLSARN